MLVGYISDFLKDMVLLDFLNSIGAKGKEKVIIPWKSKLCS